MLTICKGQRIKRNKTLDQIASHGKCLMGGATSI